MSSLLCKMQPQLRGLQHFSFRSDPLGFLKHVCSTAAENLYITGTRYIYIRHTHCYLRFLFKKKTLTEARSNSATYIFFYNTHKFMQHIQQRTHNMDRDIQGKNNIYIFQTVTREKKHYITSHQTMAPAACVRVLCWKCKVWQRTVWVSQEVLVPCVLT